MAREARKFSPVLVEAYEERIAYFEEAHETNLAALSRWRFCMPLMYIYLRGNITEKENCYILHLLNENIKTFVRCRQVPWSHRVAFTLLGLSPRLYRSLSEFLGITRTAR